MTKTMTASNRSVQEIVDKISKIESEMKPDTYNVAIDALKRVSHFKYYQSALKDSMAHFHITSLQNVDINVRNALRDAVDNDEFDWGYIQYLGKLGNEVDHLYYNFANVTNDENALYADAESPKDTYQTTRKMMDYLVTELCNK